MPRLVSLASCGVLFSGLNLLIHIYHATYYGVELPWSIVVIGTLVVCVAGVLGYLVGAVKLARDFKLRTISFIAVFSYFVSYSITNLLASIVSSPWVFVMSVFVVTALITIKIGPRWQQSPD